MTDKGFGELRRFVWITKDDETKRAWIDLVEEKGLTRKDLMLLLGAMGINYEQFSKFVPGSVSPDRSNLPEVSQLLDLC
ncbi:hypothetical protein [Synergistes jonesii]|uniref:hypothetical protein n=1 Tax=Synergistes jonesii TaxID=2754 RepID=UPI003330C047